MTNDVTLERTSQVNHVFADGNELNLMNTLSAVGIMVGSPFSTLALTKIQPRFWLPLCTMLWSFCVLGIHAAKNVETIYALRYAEDPRFLYILDANCNFFRFCAGLFESVSTPGVYYLASQSKFQRTKTTQRLIISSQQIGSWYRKSEITRRIALFGIASGAGPMFSSYIQSGL